MSSHAVLRIHGQRGSFGPMALTLKVCVSLWHTWPLNTLLKAAEEGYLKPKTYQGRSVGLCTSGSPCVCPCRLHSFRNGCGTERQYVAVVLVKNVFFSQCIGF